MDTPILVEYIKSEQYLPVNGSQKNTRIDGTVWSSTCVVKKWPFWRRCEQNRHFGRYLSWYGSVNSYKTHLGDVALILLYLLKQFPCLCAKYKCVNKLKCGALGVQKWPLYVPLFLARPIFDNFSKDKFLNLISRTAISPEFASFFK